MFTSESLIESILLIHNFTNELPRITPKLSGLRTLSYKSTEKENNMHGSGRVYRCDRHKIIFDNY